MSTNRRCAGGGAEKGEAPTAGTVDASKSGPLPSETSSSSSTWARTKDLRINSTSGEGEKGPELGKERAGEHALRKVWPSRTGPSPWFYGECSCLKMLSGPAEQDVREYHALHAGEEEFKATAGSSQPELAFRCGGCRMLRFAKSALDLPDCCAFCGKSAPWAPDGWEPSPAGSSDAIARITELLAPIPGDTTEGKVRYLVEHRRCGVACPDESGSRCILSPHVAGDHLTFVMATEEVATWDRPGSTPVVRQLLPYRAHGTDKPGLTQLEKDLHARSQAAELKVADVQRTNEGLERDLERMRERCAQLVEERDTARAEITELAHELQDVKEQRDIARAAATNGGGE